MRRTTKRTCVCMCCVSECVHAMGARARVITFYATAKESAASVATLKCLCKLVISNFIFQSYTGDGDQGHGTQERFHFFSFLLSLCFTWLFAE